MRLPVYAISAQGRPQTSVAALGRPAVVSVTVPGQQGAQGKAGARGITTGFGQVTYTNRTLEPDDVFEAGQRAQVLLNPDTPVDSELNRPFDTHNFWVNNAVRPRARGDLYDIQVNLRVTADTAGGELRLDADVGSPLGPIASDTQSLFDGAGTPERVTFRLRIQVLDNFLANGCRLYLTSSVRITTISETVLVAPQSLQPDTLPPDPEAASPTLNFIAATTLSGHRAVRPVQGGVGLASASDPTQANTVLGITRGAALPGKPVAIAIDGPLEEPTWSWAPGPVFLGEGGALTQTAPTAGFVQRLGVAVSPTTLVIQIGPAVVKS